VPAAKSGLYSVVLSDLGVSQLGSWPTEVGLVVLGGGGDLWLEIPHAVGGHGVWPGRYVRAKTKNDLAGIAKRIRYSGDKPRSLEVMSPES